MNATWTTDEADPRETIGARTKRWRSLRRTPVRARSIASNACALADARGRVLAERSPPTPTCRRSIARGDGRLRRRRRGHASARAATTPKVLRSVETIFTGAGRRARPSRGECVEIATGAPLPDGADAVVMVEETERADGSADAIRVVHAGLPRPARRTPRRRHRGGPAGARSRRPAQPEPHRCPGSHRGARRRRLRTPACRDPVDGQRDRRAGRAARPGQIYDINRFTLSAISRRARRRAASSCHGCPTPAGARRRADRIRARRTSVVFSGGSSVGERDLILDVLQAAGDVIFHGIAVKPGKPTVFGRVSGTPGAGHAGQPDVVPVECLSAARADAAPDGAPARAPAANRPRAARAPHRLDDGTASVLHRANRRWRRRSGVQGLGRHHQHVAARTATSKSRRRSTSSKRASWLT